jgi:hypothetical protein
MTTELPEAAIFLAAIKMPASIDVGIFVEASKQDQKIAAFGSSYITGIIGYKSSKYRSCQSTSGCGELSFWP